MKCITNYPTHYIQDLWLCRPTITTGQNKLTHWGIFELAKSDWFSLMRINLCKLLRRKGTIK